MAKKEEKKSSTIAQNKKARYDYFIEERFEAGLALQGWEVKSLRAGKAQLVDSFVMVRNGEAWLHGSHLTPLNSASTHVNPEPARIRKLLLNRREIDRLTGLVERKGYTLVALELYARDADVAFDIAEQFQTVCMSCTNATLRRV